MAWDLRVKVAEILGGLSQSLPAKSCWGQPCHFFLMPKYEKMSKSRGNVVLPEEVVYGICDLEKGFEFRDIFGQVVDWKVFGVWRDKLKTGYFFTSTRTGRQPVFLYEDGEPCILLINGEEKVQHSNLDGETLDGETIFVAYRRKTCPANTGQSSTSS